MVNLSEPTQRDRWLMDLAKVVSQRGTCSRLQVGVVFSRRGRVISTGYNGAPSGLPHCNHICNCFGSPECEAQCNSQQPCTEAEHAERNAIAFAARHGVALEGTEMHVTHMPCLACAMSIINAGIETVVYDNSYRDFSGVELLELAGITVVDLNDPS